MHMNVYCLQTYVIPLVKIDACCIDVIFFFFIPDLYRPTGEMLGNGSYASVQTYKNNHSNKEYAVKVIIYLLIHYYYP